MAVAAVCVADADVYDDVAVFAVLAAAAVAVVGAADAGDDDDTTPVADDDVSAVAVAVALLPHRQHPWHAAVVVVAVVAPFQWIPAAGACYA